MAYINQQPQFAAMPQPYPPPQMYPQPQMYPPPGMPGYPMPPQQHQQVIQMQPLGPGYGQPDPNVPPGLEFLTMTDKLFIKQKVELLEVFVGFETNNKYTVKAGNGQKMFYAMEDVDCCTRNCCGKGRPFDMKILDLNQREVIHLDRPLRCDSCFCPCCLQEITVSCPPGTVVGSVTQNWSICSPCFNIRNAAGDTVLKIEGPCCTCSLCGRVEFKVMSRDGEVEVGRISKEWSGLAREFFTDVDNFGISFPMDLDVKMKAVMLAAAFLIDYMYFEKNDEGAICKAQDTCTACGSLTD